MCAQLLGKLMGIRCDQIMDRTRTDRAVFMAHVARLSNVFTKFDIPFRKPWLLTPILVTVARNDKN